MSINASGSFLGYLLLQMFLRVNGYSRIGNSKVHPFIEAIPLLIKTSSGKKQFQPNSGCGRDESHTPSLQMQRVGKVGVSP